MFPAALATIVFFQTKHLFTQCSDHRHPLTKHLSHTDKTRFHQGQWAPMASLLLLRPLKALNTLTFSSVFWKCHSACLICPSSSNKFLPVIWVHVMMKYFRRGVTVVSLSDCLIICCGFIDGVRLKAIFYVNESIACIMTLQDFVSVKPSKTNYTSFMYLNKFFLPFSHWDWWVLQACYGVILICIRIMIQHVKICLKKINDSEHIVQFKMYLCHKSIQKN